MKNLILYGPFFFQGLFILLDEMVFHRRRGLPRWEIWGHPLDSISVAIPFAIAGFFPFEPSSQFNFMSFSIFSSLFVTKDEFIHSKVCTSQEQFLHALLFILHPTAFFCAYQIWEEGERIFILQAHFSLVLLFTFYQILYWGVSWNFLQRKIKQKSIK